MVRVIDVDVLVVGSGAAGLCSAIHASKHGIKVLVITKGLLSRGGCSRMAGTHWGPRDANRLDYGRAYELGTHLRLVDHNTLARMVEYSPEAFRQLEEMGIYYKRTSEGEVAEGDYPDYPVAWKIGETGQRVMDVLYSEILRRRIEFLEDTPATSMLTKQGGCVGATALNLVKGEFLVIRAKSVILTTGHVGYQWRYSSQSREVTGDGIAMAYWCGADLINMEFQHWHHSDVKYPESARRMVIHNLPITKRYLGEEGVRKMGREYPSTRDLFDADGKNVMKELKHLASTGDTFHSTSIQVEVAKKYGKRGLFIRFNEGALDTGGLAKYLYYFPVISKLHDPKSPIPVGTSAHTHAGGIRINEKCETNIPGLYAAGGAAGMYPTEVACLWGGETSGKYASERADEIPLGELDWDQVNVEEERVNCLLRSKHNEGFTPPQVKRMIRDLMWKDMWILKTEASMKRAFGELLRIRQEVVPRMGLEYTGRAGNFGWGEALDVACMLAVCELVVQASLVRKESRGCFYVEEYPREDNENWLKNIVMRRRNGELEVRVEPAVNVGPP